MQIFIIKTRCSVDAVYFQIVNHEIIISPSKIPRMYFILHRRLKRIIYPHTCKMVLRFAMKAGCVISRRKTGSSFFSFFLFSQIFFSRRRKFRIQARETRTDTCNIIHTYRWWVDGEEEGVDFCRIRSTVNEGRMISREGSRKSP